MRVHMRVRVCLCVRVLVRKMRVYVCVIVITTREDRHNTKMYYYHNLDPLT